MPAPSDESENAKADAEESVTVELQFYAPFKETVGQKSVVLELSEGATVGDALARVVEDHPALDGKLLNDARRIPDGVRALYNGHASAEADTRLEDGDEVSLTTPIHGG